MSEYRRPKPQQLPPLYTRFSSPATLHQYDALGYPKPPAAVKLSNPAPPPARPIPRDLPTPLRIAPPPSEAWSGQRRRVVSYAAPSYVTRSQKYDTQNARLRSKYAPSMQPQSEYIPYGAAKEIRKPSSAEEIASLVQKSIDELQLRDEEIAVMHASPSSDYLASPSATSATPSSAPETPVQFTPIVFQTQISAKPEPSPPPTPTPLTTTPSLFKQIRKTLTFTNYTWTDIDDEKESEEYTDAFEEVKEDYKDPKLGVVRIGTIRR